MPAFVVRVRGPTGIWRIQGLTQRSTVMELQQKILDEHGVSLDDQSLFFDQQKKRPLPAMVQDSLVHLKIQHGDMLYIEFDSECSSVVAANPTTRKTIAADGSIVASTSSASEDAALRPGLFSLRNMKMQWTMEDLMEIESDYTFKIQRQAKALCTGVSLDSAMCQDFQLWCRQLQFQRYHVAWLYGRYVKVLPESKANEELAKAEYDSFGRELKVKVTNTLEAKEETEVKVDFMYEPPQEGNQDEWQLLDDPNEEYVDKVAAMLGAKRVGLIFSHPPRTSDVIFRSNEVITCAEAQLIATGGEAESPFVTAKVTLDEQGKTQFDAYQLSTQCVQMVAEGALLFNPEEVGKCFVHETFSVMKGHHNKKQGDSALSKEVEAVENDLFLCNVPIMQHTSRLSTGLSQANRPGGHEWIGDPSMVLHDFLKSQRAKSPIQRVSDFQVLLLLAKIFEEEQLQGLCECIVGGDDNKNSDTNALYEALIDSLM